MPIESSSLFRFAHENKKRTTLLDGSFVCLEISLVADVLILGGVKEQVADRSNQRINAKGQVSQDEVHPGAAGVTFRLQVGVVDDDATDKAQEEGQQEANDILVIHFMFAFLQDVAICYDMSVFTTLPFYRKFPYLSRFISSHQNYVKKATRSGGLWIPLLDLWGDLRINRP